MHQIFDGCKHALSCFKCQFKDCIARPYEFKADIGIDHGEGDSAECKDDKSLHNKRWRDKKKHEK